MTETKIYEPARMSTPPKPLFSLQTMDANLVKVIVIQGLSRKTAGVPDLIYSKVGAARKPTESQNFSTRDKVLSSLHQNGSVNKENPPQTVKGNLTSDPSPCVLAFVKRRYCRHGARKCSFSGACVGCISLIKLKPRPQTFLGELVFR